MQKALEIAIILSAVDRMSRTVNAAVNNVVSKLDTVGKKSEAISKKAFQLGRDFGAVGLATGSALLLPIREASRFEDGMSNIRKVTEGLNDQKALAEFGKEIRLLSREIPLPINQLQELVAAGGRMGIPKDQLINYTREVAKMSMAFDAVPGEIGEQMGKLATVFNIPIPAIGKLADTINYLDDNAIAKGTDIIDVMRRVGGTAQQVGLAAPNVAALASTFLTLGSSAEISATASNALIRELAIAEQQPARFQAGLEKLGISAATLQKNMSVDPQNTILGVLEKINALPKDKQIGVTTQLFGKEYGDDIAKLAGGMKEYRRQLELLNDPKLNGSMQREFAIRAQNASAQAQILSNNVRELGIMFGTALLPMVNRAIAAVKPYIQQLVGWVERNQDLAATIGGIVAGIAAFSLAASGISFIVGGVAKGITLLTTVLGWLTKGIGFVIKVFNVLRIVMLTNPIIAIIAAIAVAVFLIYKYWGPISAWFKQLWEKIKQIFWAVWEWIKKWFIDNSLIGYLIKHWGDFKEVFDAFYNAGAKIMDMLWQGIKDMAHKPIDAIKDTVGKMREYLPFSPAKVGPFRDLHRVKIVETIAQAVKPAPLVKAFKGVAQNAADAIGGRNTLSPVSIAGTGGGMVLNFQPQISFAGPVGADDKENIMQVLRQYQGELVRLVEDAMARKNRARY